MPSRPTLGIYAPLPGTPSGIADYAQYTAANGLADRFNITFVALDNYTLPYEFDRVLYHVGNGRHSVAPYRAASIRPGPVILHEYVLSQFFIENHDLLDDETNAHVRETFSMALRRKFSGSAELHGLMRRERELELHYLDLGLERLVVARATVVFVHSPTSLATLRSRYDDRVQPIAFPVEPLSRRARRSTRTALGIPPTATVFGSFGFVGTNKRLPAILEAWAALNMDPTAAHLLIVGAGAGNLRPPATGSATIIDYVPDPERYTALLSGVDVGIQLRWPTLGETSGMAARLLIGGASVLVSTESILPAGTNPDRFQVIEPDSTEPERLANAIAFHATCEPRVPEVIHGCPMSSWHEKLLPAIGI